MELSKLVELCRKKAQQPMTKEEMEARVKRFREAEARFEKQAKAQEPDAAWYNKTYDWIS